MNFILLNQLVEENFITVKKHPEADLFIYNYTAKTQYEQNWNEWTLACRGLIMDANQQIVARPFGKFFNLGELKAPQIPNEPFKVFEKMDGSLGILYWVGDEPRIATRGSFTSAQALKATHLLHTQYAASLPLLDRKNTYLFEIIYPENRIVVNYGREEALVLLAVVDTQSGKEGTLTDIGFPVVKQYNGIKDFRQLATLEEENREGFVVKFNNDFRLKVKFEEYVRLHRILTQVTPLSIWEVLWKGDPLDAFLEGVPDEFYQWARGQEAHFRAQFKRIEEEAKRVFKVLDTRKETAIYFQGQKHTSILFKMLDEQSYAPLIWKLIRPKTELMAPKQTKALSIPYC